MCLNKIIRESFRGKLVWHLKIHLSIQDKIVFATIISIYIDKI